LVFFFAGEPVGAFAGFKSVGVSAGDCWLRNRKLLPVIWRIEAVGLCIAADTGHRIVGPFPGEIQRGNATIKAAAGIKYEVLIDGQRIVAVASQGTDVIALDN